MLQSFVERQRLKLLVDNATSTSDDPTPIYVLDELVQALAAGDTRAGVDAVSARLAHRSPVVKQKALKVVTHIGRKGASDLRRLMARQSGAVRELLTYRCEPDPFKGDTVWKRVQEYAQEALNALHGEPESAAPASGSLRGRIEGFGSGGGGGGGYSGGMQGFGSDSAGYSGGGGGRMQGFGSADVVHSGMQAISSGMRTLSGGRADGYSSQLEGGGGYGGGGGRAGGGLVQGPIAAPLAAANGSGGGAAAERAASAAAPAASSGRGGLAAEQRLVDRICTPAGLRAAPSRDDLRAFVEGIATLDGPAVAQLLERKLDAGPWQSTLRALCAIETVAEGGGSAACDQVAAHFRAHPEALRRAADSPQASVRQRAAKALALLGGEAAPKAAAGTAGLQQQQQQLFTEDLLGEVEGSGAASSGGASAAAIADLLGEPAPGPGSNGGPAAAGSSAADLLAGLDVAAAGGAPAAAPAPPAPSASSAGDDLLGGMLLGAQPAAQPALQAAAAAPSAAPVPAAPVPAASPLDLLGELSVSSPAAAQAAAPAALAAPAGGLGDLLGGLSLGQAAAAPAMGTLGSMRAPASAQPPPFQPPQQQPPQQQWPGMAAPAAAPGWAMPPPPPFQQQAPHFGMAPPSGSYQPGLASMGSGGFSGVPPPHNHGHPGTALHGRQPSHGSGTLASSGVLNSAHDNAFDFVDTALAAARRKQ